MAPHLVLSRRVKEPVVTLRTPSRPIRTFPQYCSAPILCGGLHRMPSPSTGEGVGERRHHLDSAHLSQPCPSPPGGKAMENATHTPVSPVGEGGDEGEERMPPANTGQIKNRAGLECQHS